MMATYSPRHAKTRDWSRVRLAVVAVVFGLCWLALWARAFQVQVLEGGMLAERASRQHLVSEFISGERGRIFDSRGRVLAQSVQCSSVYARPLEVDQPVHAARDLARILGVSAPRLVKDLTDARPFIWIARQVSDREAAKVAALNYSGIHLVTEYKRLYPNGHLAGQLLGFCGLDGEGLEGLEKSLNGELAGTTDRNVVQRDARGRRLYLNGGRDEESARGTDIRLTIDADIQAVAELAVEQAVTRYSGSSGTALVVETGTGSILAWAQYPFFNPNIYREYGPGIWRNRIALDALEPGSTFKPFIVATALQERIVRPNSVFDCENGRFTLDGITIRDTHDYDTLTVSDIVRLSSNIGMAKIGLTLGAQRVHSYLEKLGFGDRLELGLPGESRGILRDPGRWQRVDLASAAFGQGVAVTALQMARGYLCLANGGVLRPLRLQTNVEPDEPALKVFDSKVTAQVLTMLQDVVEGEGTGTRARIKGMHVGGKTGTAQKASATGGYGGKYLASFVGLFPAERPRYLVMVMVDEPHPQHYGGVVAAPAVRDIALKALAYLGELPEVAADTPFADAGDAQPAREALRASIAAGRNARTASAVPDVVGLPLRRAIEIFATAGIMPDLRGDGYIIGKQSPAPGTPWNKTGKAVFWLSDTQGRG
ncbi:cell division protein FtsI (penicillin-binding protein 3) [Desulfobaculum xiamenense]|uniref:Cell division protein FtsI (Penicillin-binding protein 3) n=1 Tax=Desulfobaculum xiamenense TaxID=995050 RepID=A0A846QL34_9BACT|nr:penicillin-binding transpeptidase domain-containing protein [Desulfobaculum xiamenense]NJB67760.1 cell division protein FtsI (penicillin-binding protein 3) [Desulfobaculum xiamenense]